MEKFKAGICRIWLKINRRSKAHFVTNPHYGLLENTILQKMWCAGATCGDSRTCATRRKEVKIYTLVWESSDIFLKEFAFTFVVLDFWKVVLSSIYCRVYLDRQLNSFPTSRLWRPSQLFHRFNEVVEKCETEIYKKHKSVVCSLSHVHKHNHTILWITCF